MKNYIALIIILTLCLQGKADDFKWKTRIDSVSKSDFYKIQLSPDIISRVKDDYSDLRIFDSKQNEIQFLFVSENSINEQTKFKPYKILENKYLSKKNVTRIVIQNNEKSIISSFVLQIRNTEIEKEITLKGSDNQKDWYIIKRNYPVLSSNAVGKTSELRILDFPKSNYTFFEITLNDKRQDPLQVMNVGYYDSQSNQGLYSEITAPSIHQTDSLKLKKSFVKLTFREPCKIDRICLTVKGPDYYMRNCTVGRYQTYHKENIFETFNSFVIRSGLPVTWDFHGINTKELIIKIENTDNVPLKITGVTAYQLSKYLIANLKSGEKYTLYFGNEKTESPNYDLQYFTNKIPKEIAIIKTKGMVLLPLTVNPGIPAFFSKIYVWIALIIVIGLLMWLTIKITQEMNVQKPG